MREFLPPVLTFAFVVRCFTKSCGFFFIMNEIISRNTQPREKMSAFSVSCTRERGLGIGFVFLNPKLNPEKSAVGALVNFWRCDPLLVDDPDELLLMMEVCLFFGAAVAGPASVGKVKVSGAAWASGAPYM